jgi:hypothetical protein
MAWQKHIYAIIMNIEVVYRHALFAAFAKKTGQNATIASKWRSSAHDVCLS